MSTSLQVLLCMLNHVTSFRNLQLGSFLCIKVWDVISNDEAIAIVSSAPDREKSAKRLVECAVRAWKLKRRGIATDDISAICIFLHNHTSSHSVRPVITPL